MARSDDFSLTDEELNARTRTRQRRVIIGVIVLLLLVGAFLSAKPTFRAIKAWQARRHAKEAFALIEQEKWTEARDAAVAAYQLRATEPEALRAVARLLSRTGQEQALDFWDKLAEQQPLTRDDLRDEATVSLTSQQPARAGEVIMKLLERDPTPRDWLLATQLSLQKGSREEAQQHLEKVLAGENATPREQLQAVAISLSLSLAGGAGAAPEAADTQRAAMGRLTALSARPDAVGLDALLLLARLVMAPAAPPSSRVPSAEADVASEAAAAGATIAPLSSLPGLPAAAELAGSIERHPLAKVPHKLLAFDVQISAKPSSRAAFIDRSVAEYGNGDDEARAALAAWLSGKGEHQRVLDMLPPEKALQSRELFLPYVDALAGLGRWEETRTLLESERFPLDPVIQRMYLARCNAQLGQKAAGDNNWRRALEAAAGDVGKLLMVADYAEKNGIADVAASAYDRAAAEAPKSRAVQQRRLRVAFAMRDTKKCHEILVDMLGFWPNDAAIQNDEAYFQLLLMETAAGVEATVPAADSSRSGAGPQPSDISQEASPFTDNRQPAGQNSGKVGPAAELAKIVATAESLVAREPASLPHRTLLALARLKKGDAAGALEVYSGLQVTPEALTASALAVHAAVLAANGHAAAAATEAQQIQPEQLLSQERTLLAGLIVEQ